jgi:hypothetical protein
MVRRQAGRDAPAGSPAAGIGAARRRPLEKARTSTVAGEFDVFRFVALRDRVGKC